MFSSSLSLLSFTYMQFRRYVTLPTIESVKRSHIRQRQLCLPSCNGNSSDAVASLLYSVRFFGNTGMAGSITSESISLPSQGCKLELVREMPPILAAKMESNRVKEEQSKVNSDAAHTEHESKNSADISNNGNTKEKEETIIDFTQTEKVALLQQHRLEKEMKMFSDKSIHYYKTCLTEEERRNLVNMIYKTHYEPMNSEYVGSATERVSESAELLWDEACMELKEITIWACKVEFEQQEEKKQKLQHPHKEKQNEEQQEEHEQTKSCTKDKNENICSRHNVTKIFVNVTDNNQDSAKHETVDKHQESIRKRIKRAVLERVDLHKPLSYIIGNQLFYDCDICCNAPLLCPRPETEMWVHWYVQQHLKPVLRSWKLQQTQKVTWQTKKESRTQKWPSFLRLSKWAGKHKNIHDDKKSQHHKADKEESYKSESVSSSLSSPNNDGANMIRVLDMCCGTGCVGVAIAKHIPTAHITAVDIDQQAVEITAKNAKLNHIAVDRFYVMTSNLFECFLEPLPNLGHECNKHKLWSNQRSDGAEKLNCDDSTTNRRVASEYIHYFDALVCNPPYILPNEYDTLAPSVRLWESKVALVGDTDRASRQYMYFKEILEYGAQLLKDARRRLEYMRDVPNIVIEVGLQAELVASMMERSGLYDEVEIHLDMAQRQRWISALSK